MTKKETLVKLLENVDEEKLDNWSSVFVAIKYLLDCMQKKKSIEDLLIEEGFALFTKIDYENKVVISDYYDCSSINVRITCIYTEKNNLDGYIITSMTKINAKKIWLPIKDITYEDIKKSIELVKCYNKLIEDGFTKSNDFGTDCYIKNEITIYVDNNDFYGSKKWGIKIPNKQIESYEMLKKAIELIKNYKDDNDKMDL